MPDTPNQIFYTSRIVPPPFVGAYLALGWKRDPDQPLECGVMMEYCGPGFPVEPERDDWALFDFEVAA